MSTATVHVAIKKSENNPRHDQLLAVWLPSKLVRVTKLPGIPVFNRMHRPAPQSYLMWTARCGVSGSCSRPFLPGRCRENFLRSEGSWECCSSSRNAFKSSSKVKGLESSSTSTTPDVWTLVSAALTIRQKEIWILHQLKSVASSC